MFKFLFMLLLPLMAVAQNTKTYIPPQAFQYFDTIKSESSKFMPELDQVYYLPGLIEHESCISLKHSKCWNPKSQLKSKREEGGGLGQITRAYTDDGKVRFDSLSDMAKRHKSELKELSWDNLYTRPDLQIRSIILMTRDNYRSLYDVKDNLERLKMSDIAYNGGLGGLQKERRVCGLAKDCDPNIWFGNVEKFCLKSKKPLYGGRNACDINRHHAEDVFHTRMPKYEKYF